MYIFNFPKEWKIDKNVPKEIIYKVADADEKLKKIFIENVERIRLIYSLSTNNTNIEKYITVDERYDEINFLKVVLRTRGKENIILKLMHKLILKGTVIILEFQDEILISLSNKKIENNKIIIVELYNSQWLDNKNEYLKEFNYKNYDSGNLKFFYNSILEKIKIYNLSKILKIDTKIDSNKIERLEELTNEIEELKLLRKKETQMNKIADIQSKLITKIEERESLYK